MKAMKELELAPDGGLEVELDLRNRALRLIGEKMAECRLQFELAKDVEAGRIRDVPPSGPNEIARNLAFTYLLAMLEASAVTQLDYDDLHEEISGW